MSLRVSCGLAAVLQRLQEASLAHDAAFEAVCVVPLQLSAIAHHDRTLHANPFDVR